MSATSALPMFLQFFNPNNSGAPAVGFQLFTYQAGTTTKKATWTDSSQGTQNANPLALDANGRAIVWGDPTLSYKFVLAPLNSPDPPTSPVWTQDDIEFPLDLSVLTQTVIGGILYPQTAAETAAGVTPANYAYAPGNIWRYGAKGDGLTDDTAAVAAMLACGAQAMLLENGTFLCSGSQTLAASGTSLIARNATLLVKDETGILTGLGLINVTGSNNYIDLAINGNGFGLSLLVLGVLNDNVTNGGNANIVKIVGSNMTRSVNTQGYESVVLVQGQNNTVSVWGYNLTAVSDPTAPTPRLVTCQGYGSGTNFPLLFGRNIVSGLCVASHTDIVVQDVDIDTATDVPFYLLSESMRVKVCGGRLRKTSQPFALKGTDNEICGLHIIDPVASATIEDVVNGCVRNCRWTHTVGTVTGCLVGVRSTNVTSTGFTLENCEADTNFGDGALFDFSTGTVDDVRVIGGTYRFTYQSASLNTSIVLHATGNQVTYRNVNIELFDATGTLTSASLLNLDIPTLSEPSVYEDVDILNNTAGTVREGTVGGFSQANLSTRSRASLSNGGLYLGGYPATAHHEVRSSGAPTAGAWAVGDIAWNNAPSVDSNKMVILGWICTAAGSPGTWSPMYASTTSPVTT